MQLHRYSEPYNATGGMAAVGVLNQLGRPDTEALEVLVREAVQNCWDAKRPNAQGIRVDIGRRQLTQDIIQDVASRVLPDPPDGLPLAAELQAGLEILYFADFGTGGLAGPTRADQVDPEQPRDFVDFVRNIGQPPDKELGGGSYGFGKAAFYIASRAQTIMVDTLCETPEGSLQRRFIACALGEQFTEAGNPCTGRHWWGRMVDGVPEPLLDEDAGEVARLLGLPERNGPAGLGTTVAIVAPDFGVATPDGVDVTMGFIAEALVWNFWPRMTSTPGGVQATMRFELNDDGHTLRVPNPRTHERLRGFVEAMDRLRAEPDHETSGPDEPLVIDQPIECLRPIQALGRLVIQRGPVAPTPAFERAVPQGALQTADGLHHVAIMRNAELIVKYLSGPDPVTGRFGYSGAFRCSLDVDRTFARAEPPTHDNWVPRFLEPGHDRTFVKVALDRIARLCREAAGYDSTTEATDAGDNVPLGEFADALATLMPTLDGPGARHGRTTGPPIGRRRRHAPGGRSSAAGACVGVWVDVGQPGTPLTVGVPESGPSGAAPGEKGGVSRGPPARPGPQVRSGDEPRLTIADDGAPVIHYPFELRGRGNRMRLSAAVEVMTNDGAQVESEAPLGQDPPEVREWIDPSETRHRGISVDTGPDDTDGSWTVVVPLVDDVMIRVDVVAQVL